MRFASCLRRRRSILIALAEVYLVTLKSQPASTPGFWAASDAAFLASTMSTTCLAIARAEGFGPLYSLSFDYGQRHRFELEAAKKIARVYGVKEHRVIQIDLRQFGKSALTDDIAVPKDRDERAMGGEIPVT